MYRDLEPELWPREASIVDHPMVRRLLGAEEAELGSDVPARDPSELDEAFHPSKVFQVMDADSSQQIAIAAARDGTSAVIEGPPGTGKSQTITNVIAECLAQGKRVLFVAEKAAALEVVQRRLRERGPRRFPVLELHSRKTSKAAVLAELQRCLAGAQDEAGSPDVDPDELAGLRSRANAYVRELHVRRSGLDLSAYDAMSHVALIRSDGPERLRRAEPALVVVDDHAGWPRRARRCRCWMHVSRESASPRLTPGTRSGSRVSVPTPSRGSDRSSGRFATISRPCERLAPSWRRFSVEELHDHCERPLTWRRGRAIGSSPG